MDVETVKMSSKGQIVIPQEMREEMSVGEGTVFAVVGSSDTIVLKKINMPSGEDLINELKNIAKTGKKRLIKRGIKEEDIPRIVEESRRR